MAKTKPRIPVRAEGKPEITLEALADGLERSPYVLTDWCRQGGFRVKGKKVSEEAALYLHFRAHK